MQAVLAGLTPGLQNILPGTAAPEAWPQRGEMLFLLLVAVFLQVANYKSCCE